MRTLPLLALLIACGGANEYIVDGTVYEKPSPTRIVVDHKDIPNFMPAMIMPFDVMDPAILADVDPGDTILARLKMRPEGAFLEKVRVTGTGVIPDVYTAVGTNAVLPGAPFPSMDVTVHDGSTWHIGPGQTEATAITFIYTRCPLPDFCPLTMSRLRALQDALGGTGRLLAITLDPDFDTNEVLAAYASTHGAVTGEMMMARVSSEQLETLATAAGLSWDAEAGEVLHGLRLVVTAADGTVIERYDDNHFPHDRVVSQLRTGEPKAPPGSEGTRTQVPEAGE